MADTETTEKEENIDATTTTETEQKATGTDQTSTEKTFTQADVNKIVAKEKASWKRTHDASQSEHDTVVTGLQKDIEKRDAVIQSTVDLLKKDLEIDEDEWQAGFADRDVLEQYQYLVKRAEKAAKKDAQFPRTPKGKQTEKKFSSSFVPSV